MSDEVRWVCVNLVGGNYLDVVGIVNVWWRSIEVK